jgi:hypothetical protein
MRKLFGIIFALIIGFPMFAQVSVAPSPVPRIQFLDSNGHPLSGGRVFTYAGGTTTLENTYIDAGGISQNTDPIILNAGGFANIWLANKSYKFVVQNSSGSTQWTVDNVTGYLGLLNLSNTWTFPQTFTQALTILPSDNQLILGAPGSQTIFDAPPSAGTVTLHFQTGVSDTVVNRDSTDTLLNKTLVAPIINGGTQASPTITTPTINGVKIANSPGTYIVMPNETVTGTTLNRLAKFTAASPSGVVVTGSDTDGSIGVVIANAGISGIASIQQSGTGFCQFDNATTASDYVQIGTAGQCHDVGAVKPTIGQIIGRVLATNGSAGLLPIDLYPPEIVGVGYPRVVNRQSPSVISPASSFTSAGFNTGSSDATFRVSAFVRQQQTGIGCTGVTSTAWTFTYTDVSGSVTHPVLLTTKSDGSAGASNSIQIAATNGTIGSFVVSIPSFTFRAKSGTTYAFTGTYTAGANCTTDPGFNADIIYEQLTAD